MVGMAAARPAAAGAPDYPATLQTIARDIAALKHRFPQLKDFAPGRHARSADLVIDYGYRTYRPQRNDGRPLGGWTAQVPNPYADGVWFYVNFHDPESTAQIDTQPMVSRPCLGAKRITFLILEGTSTKPLAGRIRAILERHGARRCD
jgi:hypothetical protein